MEHSPSQSSMQIPRHGFMRESRSCPHLGPGLDGDGRPLSVSPRFVSPTPQGPARASYDLPPVTVYRSVGSFATARMGPGFGRPASDRSKFDLVPPGEGADVLYDTTRDVALSAHMLQGGRRRLGRINTAPSLGPGLGRSTSPRGCDLVPPGSGSPTLYDLPAPEMYKQPRQPRVPRWDPSHARFPSPPKLNTDAQYSLPRVEVYRSTNSTLSTRMGPGLGRTVGPRIDARMWKVGDGADALYTVPQLSVTKACPEMRASCFSPPVHRHEVGARMAEPIPSSRMPSKTPPPWLDRLSVYQARPRAPWQR